MTHASLFSGIGGPEVAAAMLGWDNAFHCEINPFGRAVLDYWFPDSVSYEDITKTDFREWRGRIDVLTGGFPCQPFSYAGQRKGHDDDRYLWPEMLRAIDEIRPSWVVGENVAGLATMVEGGVLTDVGCESSLFAEGDEVHGYELEETFTIERICRDLERSGYSVQPVLIPAAAVGAPHRRDRIFILASYAHADGGHDEPVSGYHAGASGEARIRERDEVQLAGEPDQLRPAIQGAAENAEHVRCVGRCCSEEDGVRGLREFSPGDNERICREARADTSDADLQRLDERIHPGQPGEKERFHNEADRDWRNSIRMEPNERWAGFPAVSPVHRGNDGLPFDVDDLTIPQTRWRFESLKAYGNAIVPQVIYQIFKSIEACQTNQ